VLMVDLRNHGKSDFYGFQPPYVTFGSEEHKDLLGGFDYLKNITTGSIGLLGYSMGGSTVLVAGWKEPRIKAIFTDSPACMVLETLRSNVDKFRLSGALAFAWGCLLGNVKSRYGCAPFENDAFEAVKSLTQPVHFEHTQGDHIVPEWNTEICSKALMDRNISTTVHIEKTTCPNQHTKNIILDIQGFEQRMIGFFGKYLK
jgi:dienelactone hydrolase